MPLHIQDGGGAKLTAHEALVELEGAADLCYKLCGNGLSGAVILGVNGKDLRHKREVLVELGEGLYKVTGNGSTGNCLVIALGQEAVEGVAELVERGLDIVN